MYKEIRRHSIPAFGFIPEINSVVDICSNSYLEEVKDSLFQLYINDLNEFKPEEINYVLKTINSNNEVLNINISNKEAISILNTILSIEVETLLSVPYDFLKDDKIKKKRKKLPLNFKEYISSLHKLQIIDIESDVKSKPVINHPYFNLYRACNILCLKLNNPTNDSKTLKKFIDHLIENYKNELYKKIAINEYFCLTEETINDIWLFIKNEIIDGTVENLKLGKTVSEGNKIVCEKKALIEELDFNSDKLLRIHDDFKQNFREMLEEESVYKKVQSELIDALKEKFSTINIIVPNYVEVSFNKFIMYTLGKIFSINGDFQQLIQTASSQLSKQLKEKIFEKTFNKDLQICEFSVAVCVEGAITNELVNQIKLTDEIEVLSHERFQIWQEDINRSINRREIFFVEDEEKKKSSWFLVKGINQSKRDTQKVYEMACMKISEVISLLHYLTTRENMIYYKIMNHYPYFCFNHTSEIFTVGRKKFPYHWTDAKKLDELDTEFIDFSQDIFSKKNGPLSQVTKAIRIYVDACMIENACLRVNKYKEVLEIIFNTKEINNLAYFAAVIIAGTNYKQSDVTYGEMRKWLYEDFKEYLYYSNIPEYEAYKIQNEDRFRVFCKTIIGTYLFNLNSLSTNTEYTTKDIIDWIKYIYPDQMPIERREHSDS